MRVSPGIPFVCRCLGSIGRRIPMRATGISAAQILPIIRPFVVFVFPLYFTIGSSGWRLPKVGTGVFPGAAHRTAFSMTLRTLASLKVG